MAVRSRSVHARAPEGQVLLIAGAAVETADLTAAVQQIQAGGLRNILFTTQPPER